MCWSAHMGLERFLFPRCSQLTSFLIVACLSSAFSFLLIGPQIYQAKWGLIDDHEVFSFLGPGLHLSLNDVWSKLLAKTEAEFLQGRFRPSYYAAKLLETSLWGANVHLWYLANTIAFAVFLGSIWWILRRFVGDWLGGVLTANIALLRLWTDVWSRLGPQEIYGAACIGVMVFLADFVLFSESPRARQLLAIVLTLATILLMGMKETFFPLAGGTVVLLVLAGIRKRLPPLLIWILASVILVGLGGIVVVLSEILAKGTNFYAKPVGLWSTLWFAVIGLFDALLRTWWLFVIPILFLQLLDIIPRKPLRSWITNSKVAVGVYVVLIGMYAAQCAPYGLGFPHNSRYDFPAMLLVPLTCCILACEISRRIGTSFSERALNYAQLAAAAFLFFALISAHLGDPPALAVAVRKNIEVTNAFYNELQREVRVAVETPERPVIIEAYGAHAYEGVFSLSTYMRSLGARNRISVRFHPDDNSEGKPYDNVQQTLFDMQEATTGDFTPLRATLARQSLGCISFAVNGMPDAACLGFRVNSR